MRAVGRQADGAAPLLAIDVGAGTRDILVRLPGLTPENCPQFVIPSRTTALAERVGELTEAGRPIHLAGRLMGGGPLGSALKKHLAAGLTVTAEPFAARTIRDDLARVESMGIVLSETPPPGAIKPAP